MYAFIEGVLEQKSAQELVISAGGIGYQLLCTAAALSLAPARGEFHRVYTWLSVREDAMELFGFASPEERSMFLKLKGVSGIGPRTALGILASMPLNDLTLALITGDAVMLSRAPGVGKKTAQRLALELKDKLSAHDMSGGEDFSGIAQAGAVSSVSEAILALQSLGYTQTEAARAISAIQKPAGEDAHADDLVRMALRGMSKG